MDDLQSLAQAVSKSPKSRGHVSRKTPIWAWIFASSLTVVLLLAVSAAMVVRRNAPRPDDALPAPGLEAIHLDAVTREFKADVVFDLLDDHETIIGQALIFSMVNMQMCFAPADGVRSNPLVLLYAADLETDHLLSPQEATARLAELRQRIAAAKTLLTFSDQVRATEPTPPSRSVHVRSYLRRDGTRVRGHTRSAPNR